jgi:drug/metabolite transporter (DMT)-like permease
MNDPVLSDSAVEIADEQLAKETPASITAEHGLFHPSVFVPFLLVSLIWGSTWLVIRDQINFVPSSWSVTYRFTVAAAGMFLLSAALKNTLRLDRKGHILALVIGAVQFAINFNLVYAAEHHVTSGLVAVLFALLIIPNAMLGKFWLGRSITRNFWIGGSVACVGVGMLVLREYRLSPAGAGDVLIGTGLTIAAVISASVANVLQATDRMKSYPITTVLAWSMLYGALGNALWSLVSVGAPSFDPRAGYIGGVLYLGIIGSVVTFPLYFKLIREIGPGKAAYTSVFIPVVAMLLSTLFEGYQWTGLAVGGAVLAMAGLLISMQAARPAR